MPPYVVTLRGLIPAIVRIQVFEAETEQAALAEAASWAAVTPLPWRITAGAPPVTAQEVQPIDAERRLDPRARRQP